MALQQDVEVIVVGAGFCGLSAAIELQRAGASVQVLEARNRVGGRVEAAINGLGETVDTGGQFLCDDMPEILALARIFNKTLVATPVAGEAVLQPAPHGRHDAGEIYAGAMALRAAVRRLDPTDAAIAGLTVLSWANGQRTSSDARQMFFSMIEGLWCCPVDHLPLWYLVSSDRRITNRVSELQYFTGETMHSLASDMGASLGASLFLDHAVQYIEVTNDGVIVEASSRRLRAGRIVVALPPVMARNIDFRPELPVPIPQALAAWQSGDVVKLFLRYSSPFWRAAGLSGSVLWLDTPGIYACDISRNDHHAELVVFIGGRNARQWMASGEAGLKQIVLARLAAALGPLAAEPLDMLLRDWSDDAWSGGGYSDVVTAMEMRDAEEILRRGVPRMEFASSELSSSYPGYIEGAIIAGRLAAHRTLARISDDRRI